MGMQLLTWLPAPIDSPNETKGMFQASPSRPAQPDFFMGKCTFSDNCLSASFMSGTIEGRLGWLPGAAILTAKIRPCASASMS